MRNKRNLLLCCIVVIVGMLSVLIIMNANYKNSANSYKIADGMVKVDLKFDKQYDIDLEHSKVFTNYDDFSLYFDNSDITKESFDNSNYAIITLTYDECGYNDVIPTKYNIVGNNVKVMVYHDAACSACSPLYSYYAIKVDKDLTELSVDIDWIARNDKKCN